MVLPSQILKLTHISKVLLQWEITFTGFWDKNSNILSGGVGNLPFMSLPTYFYHCINQYQWPGETSNNVQGFKANFHSYLIQQLSQPFFFFFRKSNSMIKAEESLNGECLLSSTGWLGDFIALTPSATKCMYSFVQWILSAYCFCYFGLQ